MLLLIGMKKWFQMGVLAALVTAGCSTVPDKYKPVQVGVVNEENIADGIEFVIRPATDTLVRGEVLFFDISLKNVGADGFWFPREPEIMLTWVYSSGQRDNLLFEPTDTRHFTKTDAVYVKPGQTLKTRMKIKTYYFPRIGITEFQAFYRAPANTNPDLEPFWNGKVYSNSYGINVFSSRQAMVRQSDSNRLAELE